MTKRILYFTGSAVVTPEENADIAAINALCEPEYRLTVHNGSVDPGLKVPLQADYAAGSVPTGYSELPVFDPSTPPGPELGDDQVIVSDGGTVPVKNSTGAAIGNATATVTGGAITGAALPATIAGVANGAAVTVQNSAGAAVAGSHTATVANGVVSNFKLAATIAPVAAGNQTIVDAAGKSSTATRAVAAGAITTTTLAATDCIVKNGNTFPVSGGGTITVAVAAGAPTFTYTAP